MGAMNPTNEALVRRFYDEVWNGGNVDVAEEIFARDYVRHDLRPTRARPGRRRHGRDRGRLPRCVPGPQDGRRSDPFGRRSRCGTMDQP